MKTKANKNINSVSPVKFGALAFMSTFAVIGAAFVFASNAASGMPTGTISVSPNSNLQFGGNVYFDASVSGRLSPKGYTYIKVVCKDATTTVNNVIYQWSKYTTLAQTEGFPLIDQTGQGLDWNGQDALCIASHIYRVDGQKPTVYTMASTDWFPVAGLQ